MTATLPTPDIQTGADDFAERVFASTLGFIEIMSMALGDQLGWYPALAARGPLRSDELAELTSTDARYAHEWLEQQAANGIVTVDDPALPAADRTYRLPTGHAEVLTDRDSQAFLAPLARLLAGTGVQFEALVDAYRTGGGVPWAQFGPLVRTGQADMNRPFLVHELGTTWFPSVPDLHARLRAGARVADIGCGEGWSAIGMALHYPQVTVDGYDIDGPSIAAARGHARDAGVADRVRFHEVDAATVDAGDYDVVTAFECIHDLPHPVAVLVMDERVADRFTGPSDEVERLMYGFSILLCLPDGRSHDASAATGTVMRTDVLRDYAERAGFRDIEVLDIDNDLWRFYRLRH
jgi:SAM-dependent methyltransferase